MNKAELIDQLANVANMSKADATRAIDALFAPAGGIISDALKSGDRVQLTGFGSFESKKRAARTGRNPRTGEEIQIKASNTPSFKAGKGLKDALN